MKIQGGIESELWRILQEIHQSIEIYSFEIKCVISFCIYLTYVFEYVSKLLSFQKLYFANFHLLQILLHVPAFEQLRGHHFGHVQGVRNDHLQRNVVWHIRQQPMNERHLSERKLNNLIPQILGNISKSSYFAKKIIFAKLIFTFHKPESRFSSKERSTMRHRRAEGAVAMPKMHRISELSRKFKLLKSSDYEFSKFSQLKHFKIYLKI